MVQATERILLKKRRTSSPTGSFVRVHSLDANETRAAPNRLKLSCAADLSENNTNSRPRGTLVEGLVLQLAGAAVGQLSHAMQNVHWKPLPALRGHMRKVLIHTWLGSV